MSATEQDFLEAEEREAVRRLGHREVPEMLRELAAVADHGSSIAALAGPGSGKELLYGLAAAASCSPDSPSVQTLVLSPTPEEALRAARALHQFGAPAGLEALAWLPWRSAGEGEERPFAQLLAGRPAEILPEVQAGRLKLSDLRLLVLDGVSALEEAGGWEPVAALLDTLPAEVQKVVVDHDDTPRFRELLTHRLGSARRWPPELLGRDGEPAAEGGAPLFVVEAADEEARLDGLVEALKRAAEGTGVEQAFVRCPDEVTAHRVAASLAARGLQLTDDPKEPGVVVAWGDDEEAPSGVAALYGLPSGLPVLTRWLGPAAARAVAVTPREAAQLHLLARRAGWDVRTVDASPGDPARGRVEALRKRLRRRLADFDDLADLALLEPVLEEHGAARVAAALSALLRERDADARREEEAAAPAEEEAAPKPRRGEAKSGWARLYVSAGRKDGVGPGDLVGAITGETSVVGGQIGQIEIRETYSLVDVDAAAAEEVMEGLTGVRVKGREVIARRDRES